MTAPDALGRWAAHVHELTDSYGRTAPLRADIVLALIAEVRAGRNNSGNEPSLSVYHRAQDKTDAALRDQP